LQLFQAVFLLLFAKWPFLFATLADFANMFAANIIGRSEFETTNVTFSENFKRGKRKQRILKKP